ncbi:1-deoxy-D-xylulose-5-phosphate reductoisomerase [Pseudidiomarina andamanensis]|uniref:1-deoxy-D-xylulose 5-phosphate reductoisomerase n=1 Tax=Pseudidiomarina andamanensis TaxID=1940690 RepID=A0AA92ILA1_9GAMM|nr:1-deoxy-D-xylulose-5-phosphate reductoisomerase [Pseudidiomarina andamanensis]MDS0218182.1 1-deoxy-D-xylulose-5-phosphate reductoisomerase [Pseudidiomarina andamanensis]QGT95069.1 1-deoxy-D-xylulose-5-phosphate reductoisomerase [Pseudidiomarina andamanensis]
MKQRVTILGATGSIGQNTLAVMANHPDQFELFAVTANGNVADMITICRRFKPRYAVMADKQAAQRLQQELADLNCEVLGGEEAVIAVAADAQVDTVMAAIVGAAGLLPTMAAVKAGKRVLLANKEALVMSGQLFMDAVAKHGAELLPIDSEHNAIYQCLPLDVQQPLGHADLAAAGIHQILLTGSGGPFRELPIAQLAQQTPAAACNHPNWSMGQKISVDSATMLNKGLEYIEARWLFNCKKDQIQVLVHPQSVIHSMVSYIDGSVIAQLGQPDMRTPIAYGLGYPKRIESGVQALDFLQLGELTFMPAEAARYPCLQLAIDACWEGQWATTSLNAANEIAVAAFLQERIPFTAIAEICDRVLQQLSAVEITTVEALIELDTKARAIARQQVEQVS